MKATHRNRSLERVKFILNFIQRQIKENPKKEVFLIKYKDFFNKNWLLFPDSVLINNTIDDIKNGSRGCIKIETRQYDPRKEERPLESEGEWRFDRIWFYISDYNKFQGYRNEILQKIEDQESIVNFVLDDDGYFYVEGAKEKEKHPLRKNSDRYVLLQFLATEAKYISTDILAKRLGITSLEIRKKIGEIRNIIERKWHLPRKALFESDNISGYRVTNVTIKGS